MPLGAASTLGSRDTDPRTPAGAGDPALELVALAVGPGVANCLPLDGPGAPSPDVSGGGPRGSTGAC